MATNRTSCTCAHRFCERSGDAQLRNVCRIAGADVVDMLDISKRRPEQWAEVEGWGNEGAIIGPLNLRKVRRASPIDAEFCRNPTNASAEHFCSNLQPKPKVATFLEHLSPCAITVVMLGLGLPVKGDLRVFNTTLVHPWRYDLDTHHCFEC